MQEHTSARAAQMLRDKGFKARALLGGFAAWVSDGGETEPIDKASENTVPQQNTATTPQSTNTQPERHVVASPNPTIDDGKTPATVTPQKVGGTRVQPAATTTQTPLKTTSKSKSKSKHKQTKPRS
jgi:hypothetical protein